MGLGVRVRGGAMLWQIYDRLAGGLLDTIALVLGLGTLVAWALVSLIGGPL